MKSFLLMIILVFIAMPALADMSISQNQHGRNNTIDIENFTFTGTGYVAIAGGYGGDGNRVIINRKACLTGEEPPGHYAVICGVPVKGMKIISHCVVNCFLISD